MITLDYKLTHADPRLQNLHGSGKMQLQNLVSGEKNISVYKTSIERTRSCKCTAKIHAHLTRTVGT